MSCSIALPSLIQGGMGAGVSNWRLAKTVSEQGALGVVSGIALDTILARRLQLGDIGGHMRRALSHFPWPDVAERILEKYFVSEGKSSVDPFKLIPVPSVKYRQRNVELTVAGNFVELFLAKEGHDGLVGVNYLDKIQLPTMASLLGAMLAKVDAVLMGAGIPRAIPGILDKLFKWESVDLKLYVEENREGFDFKQEFDPKEYFPEPRPEMTRPFFMAIVSSDVVATAMVRKASGEVNGLVIENHTAGGHNAPPRKADKDNPSFSERDDPNLDKVRELGLPFW
ncbi:MAG: nitronate monooxygenase, partial [Gemmatimonadota bacterium]|nr:nitronate monooxygenase [Gemmatimonadota bacterium]